MTINQAIKIANIAIKVGTPVVSELLRMRQKGRVEVSEEDINEMETRLTNWEDYTSFDDYKEK